MSQIKLLYKTHPTNADGTSNPEIDFGVILDQSFDSIPLKGNKHYSIYNDCIIGIRNARRSDIDYIEVEKSDLDTLRAILINATDGIPTLNRRVSFMCEIIDQSITADVIEKNKK